MTELQLFKELITHTWTPAVAVVSSRDAEELCWQSNGITVAELLAPFGALHQMNGGLGGMHSHLCELAYSC
jgi:hypothetical protein